MPALPLPFGDAAIPLTNYKNFAIMAVINSRDDDMSADRQSASEFYLRLVTHEGFCKFHCIFTRLQLAAARATIPFCTRWRDATHRTLAALRQCGGRGAGE